MRFHDDDGNEIQPDLVPIPGLCITCKKYGDPSQEVFCTLTRADQPGGHEFRCDAHECPSRDVRGPEVLDRAG